jgi:hypothetical protein
MKIKKTKYRIIAKMEDKKIFIYCTNKKEYIKEKKRLTRI